MTPIYEDEGNTREALFELRKRNLCQVCGGRLDVFLDQESGRAFLACRDWTRTHHEGLMREAESRGLETLNIVTRRQIMEEELGKEKTTSLEKYEGVMSLTKVQATEILTTIWPRAPKIEVLKAAIICHQYGLNPLWKHLFLIPYKRRKEGKVVGEDWAIILGISSNRLIAQRRHHYSYLDMTPRRMTDEEQEKIFGEVDDTKIWAICKIKDIDTGAEVMGVGSWPIDEVPHGAEKGNTKLNMACIRSERQALDRQYPAELPQGIEVMEEKYIDSPFISLSKGEDKIGGQEEKHRGEGKLGATILSPPKTETDKLKKIEVPADTEQETFTIDPEWLKESLKDIRWDEQTATTWILGHFKLKEAKGTLWDILPTLTRDQAQEFVYEINTRLEKQQASLF